MADRSSTTQRRFLVKHLSSFLKYILAADGDPIFGAQWVHPLQMWSFDANGSTLSC